MVRLLGIWLLVSQAVWALESSSFAHRAQKQMQIARYPEALQLFARALKASAKEADVLGEQRIRLDMARVYFYAQDSVSLAQIVAPLHESEMDNTTRLSYALFRMEVANSKGNSTEAIQYFQGVSKLLEDCENDLLHGSLLLEMAVAKAQQSELEAELLEQAEDLLDDESPGRWHWALARIAESQEKTEEALEHLTMSIRFAQQKQPGAMVGILLAHQAKLQAKSDTDLSAATWERVVKLYEQLRLENPLLAAADQLKAIRGELPHDIAMLVAFLRKVEPETTNNSPEDSHDP